VEQAECPINGQNPPFLILMAIKKECKNIHKAGNADQ
jgi:hypothetical protein